MKGCAHERYASRPREPREDDETERSFVVRIGAYSNAPDYRKRGKDDPVDDKGERHEENR